LLPQGVAAVFEMRQQRRIVEALHGAAESDDHRRLSVVVAERGGDRAEPDLRLLVERRTATLAHAPDLVGELGAGGQRVWRESLRADAVDPSRELVLGQLGEDDLAGRRGMQIDRPPDPVDQAQQAGAVGLAALAGGRGRPFPRRDAVAELSRAEPSRRRPAMANWAGASSPTTRDCATASAGCDRLGNLAPGAARRLELDAGTLGGATPGSSPVTSPVDDHLKRHRPRRETTSRLQGRGARG